MEFQLWPNDSQPASKGIPSGFGRWSFSFGLTTASQLPKDTIGLYTLEFYLCRHNTQPAAKEYHRPLAAGLSAFPQRQPPSYQSIPSGFSRWSFSFGLTTASQLPKDTIGL